MFYQQSPHHKSSASFITVSHFGGEMCRELLRASILHLDPSNFHQPDTFEGVNTLALFPTKIHSQYCTNPTWLSSAIANPALFNTTLYVCSVHIDALKGRRQSAESLSYKCKTIKVLNEMLRDTSKATSDETISAVLLLGNILVSLLLRQIS
jgi:hypothetical protein